MFKNQEDSRLAPGLGARILLIKNPVLNPIFVGLMNRDDTNSAAIEYHETFDGTTWNTIVGTSKTVNPGQADAQLVSSSGRYIALFAQGNVLLDIHVTRIDLGDNLTLD